MTSELHKPTLLPNFIMGGGGGGGGSGVGGEGQDTSQNFEGCFWSIRAKVSM